MNYILKNATIVDSNVTAQHTTDIEITNGVITKIEKNIAPNDQFETIDLANLHVSQGWFDTSVSLGEPGFEQRETIQNGLNVAAKSGFTGIALQPNSFPIIDNQSQVNFVTTKAQNHATSLFPIGALTKNSEGKDLAELYDMKNAGAVAFGDYKKNIDNANILKIALQYTQDFDGLIVSFCQDPNIKGIGIAHEGIISTQLGMKGIPTLAEEIIVARNIFLLEYTGGKLHIPTISSPKSLDLIRDAKAKGLQITCGVAVHNLVLTDSELTNFDTRFKVLPPLRDEAIRKSLIEGVLDNTIDCISSDHNPLDIELKKMEFDLASYGTIGLESAFGALLTVLPLEIIVAKLTQGRKIFTNENHKIEVGEKANLTLFNPKGDSTFTKENILSKSKNSAFLQHPMKGDVYGILNNNQIILQ